MIRVVAKPAICSRLTGPAEPRGAAWKVGQSCAVKSLMSQLSKKKHIIGNDWSIDPLIQSRSATEEIWTSGPSDLALSVLSGYVFTHVLDVHLMFTPKSSRKRCSQLTCFDLLGRDATRRVMVRRKVKAKEPKDVDMTPKDVPDLFSDWDLFPLGGGHSSFLSCETLVQNRNPDHAHVLVDWEDSKVKKTINKSFLDDGRWWQMMVVYLPWGCRSSYSRHLVS